MTSAYPLKSTSPVRTVALAVGAVVLLHGAGLWAVQYLTAKNEADDEIEPAVLLTEIIIAEPAEEVVIPKAPEPLPPAPAPPPPPPPPPPEPPKPKPPEPRPAPKPVAKPKPITEKTPVVAPAPAPKPTPTPPAPPAPPVVAAPPAPVAPPAAVASQTPPGGTPEGATNEVVRADASNNRAALTNSRIQYPPISRRMREEGRVVLRVLVGANGAAKEVQIKSSSGFSRLDNAARDAALRNWRFTPSKRGGKPIDDWYDIPINFTLNG